MINTVNLIARLTVWMMVFGAMIFLFAPIVRTAAAEEGFPGGITESELILEGRAFVGSPIERLRLEKVGIFQLSDREKTHLTTTDDEGEYLIHLRPGSYKLRAEREGFKPTVQALTLRKDQRLDFALSPEDPNTIYGTIKNQKGELQSNLLIVALKDDKIASVFGSDEDGEYESENLPAGEYEIRVISNSSDGQFSVARREYFQTRPSKIEATFAKDYGGEIEKSFIIMTEPTPKSRLTIRTYEGVDDTVTGDQISGATIKLYRGLDDDTPPIGQGVSPLTFTDLERGRYTLIAEKKGYRVGLSTAYIGTTHGYKLIPLNPLNHKICARFPQPGFDGFWACGQEAKNMASQSQYWHEGVVLAINNVKNQYYIPPPSAVVIYSSSLRDAHYDRKYRNPDLQPSQGNAIYISTQMAKEVAKESLHHIVIHELGHLKDDVAGSSKPVSSSEVFAYIDALGFEFGNQFYLALKDSTYHPGLPDLGHPDSNFGELYASAFHAGYDHRKSVQAYMEVKDLPNALRRIINYVLDLSLR